MAVFLWPCFDHPPAPFRSYPSSSSCTPLAWHAERGAHFTHDKFIDYIPHINIIHDIIWLCTTYWNFITAYWRLYTWKILRDKDTRCVNIMTAAKNVGMWHRGVERGAEALDNAWRRADLRQSNVRFCFDLSCPAVVLFVLFLR